MDLSKEQQGFYQSARERCRQEVDEMNRTIRVEWQHLNDEIKRVQELIQTLETRKQTVGQMYASASDMLGLENDLTPRPVTCWAWKTTWMWARPFRKAPRMLTIWVWARSTCRIHTRRQKAPPDSGAFCRPG